MKVFLPFLNCGIIGIPKKSQHQTKAGKQSGGRVQQDKEEILPRIIPELCRYEGFQTSELKRQIYKKDLPFKAENKTPKLTY